MDVANPSASPKRNRSLRFDWRVLCAAFSAVLIYAIGASIAGFYFLGMRLPESDLLVERLWDLILAWALICCIAILVIRARCLGRGRRSFLGVACVVPIVLGLGASIRKTVLRIGHSQEDLAERGSLLLDLYLEWSPLLHGIIVAVLILIQARLLLSIRHTGDSHLEESSSAASPESR